MPPLLPQHRSMLSVWVDLLRSSWHPFSVFGTPGTSRNKVNSWESPCFSLMSRYCTNKHIIYDPVLQKALWNELIFCFILRILWSMNLFMPLAPLTTIHLYEVVPSSKVHALKLLDALICTRLLTIHLWSGSSHKQPICYF